LRVENPIRDTRAFETVQAHLKRLPKAPTTEEVTRNNGRNRPVGTTGDSRLPTGRVESPSSSFRTYDEGNLFRVSVPANWRELQGNNNTVTFAPDGAYGSANGQSLFTHGVEIGIERNESHDLQEATDELIQSLSQSNPQMGRPSRMDRVNIDGRLGLRAVMSNVSDATGQRETIAVYTTQGNDGTLLYTIAVAPSNAFSSYQDVFDRIVSSLRISS